jgi:putative alpha-1,2-mannosidase
MAIKLSNDVNLDDATAIAKTGSTKAEIRDMGNYLSKRSENFPLIFDPTTQFFRAKDEHGNFVQQGLGNFDPKN